MIFNSLMTEFFQGSDISGLIQGMLAHIKAQAKNPRMSESDFSLDKIMDLYINFHRLALTWGGSYTELLKWLKSKKAVISLRDNDEGCFKWAVIAALHHEEIKKDCQRISRLRPYENQYKGLSFQYRLRRLISLKRTTLA